MNGMMVRAFDGTKTSSLGEIDLKMLNGPCEFEVSFVVVDVLDIFNLLQGRLWFIQWEPSHPIFTKK